MPRPALSLEHVMIDRVAIILYQTTETGSHPVLRVETGLHSAVGTCTELLRQVGALDDATPGKPGRPSRMGEVLEELERRAMRGTMARSLALEARELEQWAKECFGSQEAPAERTIMNRIRTRHRELRTLDNN
jgi:hypothetical protein